MKIAGTNMEDPATPVRGFADITRNWDASLKSLSPDIQAFPARTDMTCRNEAVVFIRVNPTKSG
jgi:hypothetical protein